MRPLTTKLEPGQAATPSRIVAQARDGRATRVVIGPTTSRRALVVRGLG